MATTEHINQAIESMRQELVAQIQQLDVARAKFAKVRRDQQELVKRIDTLQQLYNAAVALRDGDKDKPETTADYVKAVLEEAERPMRDGELMAAMVGRGWITESIDPLATLRTFLSRLVKREEIERVAPATYVAPGLGFVSEIPDLLIENDDGTVSTIEVKASVSGGGAS